MSEQKMREKLKNYISEFEKTTLNSVKNCIEKYYDAQGIKYEPTKKPEETIVDFFAWLYRQIAPIKRSVFCSKELQQKIDDGAISEENVKILDLFKKRFENGDSMSGFLSTLTLDSEKVDYLRYTWNLYHLHMTETVATTEEEMRKNRAGYQLLAIIKDKEVLFVDVIPHPARGQSHEYFDLDHLRIIRDNGWFEKIGFSEMTDIIPGSLEPKIKNSTDIYKLYRCNTNTAFELDGKAYHPLQFIVMSGRPSIAIDTLHQIIKHVHNLDVNGNECEFVVFDAAPDNHFVILARIKTISGEKKYFDLLTLREFIIDGSKIEEVQS